MTNRERFDALSEIIDAHNEVGNKELGNAFQLEKERTKTIAKIIQEEKLLAGSWTLTDSETTASNWICLEADEKWGKFPDLRTLLEPNYHGNYCLWEDFSQTLRFDDGTLTLRLPHKMAVQFIKDYGIFVGLDRLVARRDSLAEKLNVANKLLAEMQEIGKDVGVGIPLH